MPAMLSGNSSKVQDNVKEWNFGASELIGDGFGSEFMAVTVPNLSVVVCASEGGLLRRLPSCFLWKCFTWNFLGLW